LLLTLSLLAWVMNAHPSLTPIAAGVAIFLFGMLILEQGFRTFTGGFLERILKRSTDRLWKSLAFGALASTLTQSSSLISVITISFLSAGLLGLAQGVGVIFGANLGTTSGAWLMAGLGIRISISSYAMPLLVFGVLMVFNRSRSIKGLGYVLAGIGFLFLGIHYMKEGFETFQHGLDLSRFAMGGPGGLLLYTGLGILATVIMQSSHATLILTITALAANQINYDNALALSIGANVGTTVTAIVGATSANIAGRRLAAAHLIFNLVTGVVALVFIHWFLVVVDHAAAVLGISPDNHTLKLALFHTLFNLTGILVMLPLMGRLVDLLETRMKPKPVKLDEPKFISLTMIDTPGAALEATRRELLRLFRRTFGVIAEAIAYEPGQIRSSSSNLDLNALPKIIHAIDLDARYEEKIKPLHGQILDYLAKLSARGHRAEQQLMLHLAAQDLLKTVKAAKHLQKNMIPALTSSNNDLRKEYLTIRKNLGVLLQRLDHLSALQEGSEEMIELDLDLSELSAGIEADDIVRDGRLDELIRSGKIDSSQATSLMNDTTYSYRISRNLTATAQALLLPFDQSDRELRDSLELQPEEIRSALEAASQDEGQRPQDPQ
jgi:phosphate:Na+ symporter